MENKIELLEFIDLIDMKNVIGYFIKINATKNVGSFFNRNEERETFFIGSLNEIASKYIHFTIKSINVIQPSIKEVNSLKKLYSNIKKIPAILEINIEKNE